MKLILMGILCFGLIELSTQATSALTISESTKFCEREVPNYCIQTTCPLFCNSLRSKRQRDLCNAGCTKSSRCQLRPIGLTESDRTNVALDGQTRDQLLACIAEKRDPNANKTGRKTTPWQEIRTSDFTKATRP